MKQKKIIEEFFERIEKYNSIVIFGHKNPDGDCVGSTMGFKEELKSLYPKKEIYVVGSHPSYLPSFIEDSDVINDDIIKKSLAILLDLSDLNRVEDERINFAKEIICVDHHIKNSDKNFLVYRDSEAISTTLILTEIIKYKFKKLANSKVASYFYLGLVTDSGRFQFDSSSRTFHCAQYLMSYDIDYKSIYNDLYKQDSLQLKYLSFIYSNYKVDDKVTYCVVKKEDYHKLGIPENNASGKVNSLSLVDGRPIWAFFTEQEDGTIRCELRSNGKYNVQQVAIKFNGGGHLAASGCTLTRFDEIQQVIDALNNI